MATPLVYDYKSIPIYKRNEDFLMKALTYKQQKLDTNRLQLQNLYDQYSALSVVRGVDQDYINGRLEKVKSIVDQYSAGDLSSDYLSQDLMGTLDQMVDDNVLNAVQSTKSILAENKEWDEAKDKNDGTYDEGNRAYAKHFSDLGRYINSDTVGDKYGGGGGFIAFTDVNKLLDKHAQELALLLKASYVESQNGGNGVFVDVKGKQIDRQKLEEGLRYIIGPQEQRQMTINSWNTYGQLDDNEFKNQFDSFHNASLETLKQERDKQQTFLDSSSITEDEKPATQKAIDNITAKIKDFDGGSFDNMIKNYDRPTLEKKLYSDRMLNGLLNTYSFNEVSSIKVNEAFKYANELEYKAKQLELAQERIDISRQANAISAQKGGIKLDKDGNPTGKSSSSGVSKPTTVGGQVVDLSDKANIANNAYELKQEVDHAKYVGVIDGLRASGLTPPQIQEFKKIMYSDKNLRAGNKVTLSGNKVITIDNKLAASILEHLSSLTNNTEYDKVNQKTIEDVVDVASKGMAITSTLFGGKYESIGDGNYKFVKFNSVDEAKAYTQKLVSGNDLTDDDKFSKDMFTRAVYIKDNEYSDKVGFTDEFTNTFKDKVRKTGGDYPLIMRARGITTGLETYANPQDITDIASKISNRGVPNSNGSYTYYRVDGSKDNLYDTNNGIYGKVIVNFKNTEAIKALVESNDAQVSKIYEKGAMQNDPRAVVYDTSEKGTIKQDWNTIKNMVFTTEGNPIVADNTPISVIPVVGDGGIVTDYKVEYIRKVGSDSEPNNVTIKASEFPKNGIDIDTKSTPLINSQVSGQQVSIGKLGDYIGENSPSSSDINAIQNNLSSVILGLKTQFINNGLNSDYDNLSNFQSKLLNGNITCKLVTHGDGKISADLFEDGKLLYSDSNSIKADYLTAEELANPTYSFSIFDNTVRSYLDGPFTRSTEAYKKGVDVRYANFGNQ